MNPILSPQSAAACLLVFAALLIGVTWLFGRQWGNRTVEGFTVVERRVPWIIGGPSIAAAWTWAVALMVSVQLAYQDGIAGAFWFTVPNIVAVLIYMWLGPQIRDKLPEGHSLPEWIHNRFSHRGVTTIYLIVFAFYQIMAVTVQLYAGGNLLAAATGLPVTYLIPILLIITLAYTLISGMEASVVTDCFQLVVMLVVGWLIVGLSISAAGGQFNFSGVSGKGGVNPFVVPVALTTGVISSIGLISGSISDQQFWQRCFSFKKSDIRKAFLFGGLLFGSIPLSLALLGFTAAAPQMDFQLPAGVDPSLVGFLAVQKLLPNFLAILFIFMFLAGLCSTLDSGLNASSSLYRLVVTSNIVSSKRGFSLRKARGAMVASGLIGMGIAYGCVFIPGFSLKYLWFFLNTMGAAIVIPTVLSLYWQRLTASGILIGSGAAIIVGVPLVAYGSISNNDALLAASYIGIILTSATACWLARADVSSRDADAKK